MTKDKRGFNIKHYIERTGLSKKDIAFLCDKDPAAVNQWGTKNIRISNEDKRIMLAFEKLMRTGFSMPKYESVAMKMVQSDDQEMSDMGYFMRLPTVLESNRYVLDALFSGRINHVMRGLKSQLRNMQKEINLNTKSREKFERKNVADNKDKIKGLAIQLLKDNGEMKMLEIAKKIRLIPGYHGSQHLKKVRLLLGRIFKRNPSVFEMGQKMGYWRLKDGTD